MNVKIKLRNSKAQIPKKSTIQSNGFDIIATDKVQNADYIEFKTGLSIQIPNGHVGLLVPRSSLSKYNFILANSYGILDMDFTGEITFRFKFIGEENKLWFELDSFYQPGDRIGQLLIIPNPEIQFVEVDELDSTSRGEGAYGHTGK